MWVAMFYSGFIVSNGILILWTPAYFQISLQDDGEDKTGINVFVWGPSSDEDLCLQDGFSHCLF